MFNRKPAAVAIRTLHVEREYTTAAGGRAVITTHYEIDAAAFAFDAWDAAHAVYNAQCDGHRIERCDFDAAGAFVAFVNPPYIPEEWNMQASRVITACWM